jgi:transposase-like protein
MPQFVPTEELFKGRHFDQEIVVLCVRWYLSFKLSFRDLVAMMDERGVGLAHTTILRWVQHYSGIRKAMEAIRAHHWRVLADG